MSAIEWTSGLSGKTIQDFSVHWVDPAHLPVQKTKLRLRYGCIPQSWWRHEASAALLAIWACWTSGCGLTWTQGTHLQRRAGLKSHTAHCNHWLALGPGQPTSTSCLCFLHWKVGTINNNTLFIGLIWRLCELIYLEHILECLAYHMSSKTIVKVIVS